MDIPSDELIGILDEENHLELKKKCFLVAQDIKSGSFGIVDLIKQLKELLVNVSPSKREKGILIFTEVLHNLRDFLTVQQLKIIIIFYTEKLNDHHQVIPNVLKGILLLIAFKHFPEEEITSLLNALFANVPCQQQQQADRYTIYEIFQFSLEKYEKALISMRLNLVYGVISAIDGERDPQNLLFLFKWLRKFITKITLDHLTDEIFEVMACYFPVDFKAPLSSTNNITREDLANELCPCLCAIPEFADHTLPLALEKLRSSLQIAKLDSLKLLREGCKVFSTSSYLIYGTQIWSQLQKEVFSDGASEIKIECLNTLTTVINKVSQPRNEEYNRILINITTTLKGNLLPDSKLFTPSISILLHTALASCESSEYIMKEIGPLLINTLAITFDAEQKTTILRALTKLFKTHQKHSNDETFFRNSELSTIPMLCLKASTEVDHNLRSTGFETLADLAENLSVDVRMMLYKTLHILIKKLDEPHVRASMVNCLKSLSVFYPSEVNTYILHHSKITDSTILELYLQGLCELINLSYFQTIITECLLAYATDDVNIAIVALRNIRNLLEKEQNNKELFDVFFRKKTVNKVVNYCVTKTEIGNSLNVELLLNVSYVLKILIGSQNIEIQNEILNDQINVINNYCKCFDELYVLLLNGLISRVRKGLSPDLSMLTFLLEVSIMNSNNKIRDVSVQLLANLLNKHPDGDHLNKNLERIRNDCLRHNNTHRCNVIVTLAWITKALIMRNHSEANFWVDMLFKYLDEDNMVAECLKIIMNDNYESLGSISYCNKMLLYQQKFFIIATNKITANFSIEKKSHLNAIGYLIKYVPEQALLLQFKKILKLVILCLEQCSETEVLCVILRRIKKIIIKSESAIQENLEDFVLRILNLTSYEYSMSVRISALQCLIHFSSLPLYRILPFKQKVLHQLGYCIDDKKRLVRKEAMEARTLWFLVDASV